MTTDTELIVLNTTKFGENSIILHALSRDFGRRGFLIRVGRRTGALTLLQPMNILEAQVTENPKSSLWTARNLGAKYPLEGIRSSFDKNAETMFMSEVLYRTVRDEALEEGLFDWCRKMILTLDSMESDYSNFHIRFLLEFAGALGFSPEIGDLAPFAGECIGELSRFMDLPFGESMLMPLTGAQRSSICRGIVKYLEYHTESTINLRSLEILHELYR